MKRPLPSFKTPPVNEVVIGVVYDRIVDFKLVHYGLFGQRVYKDFPIYEHAVPLGIEDLSSLDPTTGLPIPRLWLINSEDDGLIQLQADRFYYNWRSRPKRDTYPRFDAVFETFFHNWGQFTTFLHESGLPEANVVRCELTYVNRIPKEQGWDSMADLPRFFVDVPWSKRSNGGFLPTPAALSWNASFALPESSGVLNVKCQPALVPPDKTPVIILELAATGLGKDSSLDQIKNWFHVAHEWIVEGFADLTTPDAQSRVWNRYE